MGPFEVEPKHISNLNPDQLTCLLRKLLYLEADKFNIQQSAVHVPLDINVPDGGEDGRIRWSGGVDHTDYIPNCFTMFQNKAKPMSPAECKKEVIDSSNQLKSQVKKVFDEGGTYIIFCNKSYNSQKIESRIDAVREALNEAERTDHTTARIEFYDSNKIAAWVNNYFPAQVYVYQCNLIALSFGIKTLEEWQSHEEFQVKYIVNEKLEAYIHSIKELCKKETSPILRITGLSGLGKTRLALEAFRPKDDSNIEENILCSKVVYINGGLSESGLIQLVGQLRKMKRQGLLIVDDCEPSLHRGLKRELGYEGGDNIGLVTLDYNPEERHPDWMSIQLKQDDCKDIVAGIVEEIFPSLGNPVINRIEEFAQGFAGIAVLMGKQIQDGVSDIGRISDKEIVKRLLWGRDEKDEEIIAILTACSLFKCFEVSTEDYTEHLKFLAKEITDNIREKKFNDICITYRERGILQCRGRFMRVSPIPLAITLAADWWSKIPKRRAIEIINKVAKVGLAEQFCEQMKNFQFSTKVQEITKDLCGEKGLFGDPEVLLSKEGSRLFRTLVEVNPQATMDAIWRVLASKSYNELLEIKDDICRNLVWSIEMLCWWGDTFSRAARLMFNLAVAENEAWSNNAKGQFLQLFQIYLPGTEANLEERLQIIRDALSSQVQEERELAIMALGSALETESFSRSGRVESQGSRVPQSDYEPTGQEIHDYWKTCIALLRDQIISESRYSELAANEFTVQIPGLLRNGMIAEIESSITKIVEKRGPYWPNMLTYIRHSLDFDDANMPENIRVRISNLETILTPHDLTQRLRLIVSLPDWRDRKNKEGEYVSVAVEEAKMLAEEMSTDISWYDKVGELLEGEQRQAYAFGKRLGEMTKQPKPFIDACLDCLAKITIEKGNPDVLGAFLNAIKDRKLVSQTMKKVISNKKLVAYAVKITSCLKIAEDDLKRIIPLLEHSAVPIEDFEIFSYGRALNKCSESFVMEFCEKIAQHSIEGSQCALHVLYMYCYQNDERFSLCANTFENILLRKDLLLVKRRAQGVIHNWEVVSKKLLSRVEGSAKFALHLTNEIIAIMSRTRYARFHRSVKVVLSILFKKYFEDCWPIVGDALLSEQWSLRSNLEKALGTGHEKEKPDALITELPEEALFKWCNQNQPKGPAIIAHIMPIFSKDEAGIYWHPFARRIIDNFGHIEDVRHKLTSNIFSFASGGSRVPYYEKRIKLLSELSEHSCSEVRSWADNLIKYFEKEKQDAQLRTEEWEWGIH